MTSEAKIAANRRNSAKSTGPKTARGKALAAANALSHGLTARKLVCVDENWQDFASFRAAQRAALAPQGAVEEELVERIVLCAWRLRRAGRVEAELYTAYWRTRSEYDDTELGAVFARAPEKMIALTRYEAALDHALKRAMALLERAQARRRGESVPLAQEILVTGLERLAEPAQPPPRAIETYETEPISPSESTSAPE